MISLPTFFPDFLHFFLEWTIARMQNVTVITVLSWQFQLHMYQNWWFPEIFEHFSFQVYAALWKATSGTGSAGRFFFCISNSLIECCLIWGKRSPLLLFLSRCLVWAYMYKGGHICLLMFPFQFFLSAVVTTISFALSVVGWFRYIVVRFPNLLAPGRHPDTCQMGNPTNT